MAAIERKAVVYNLSRIRVSPMQHGWAEFLETAGGKMQELHGKNPFEALR